MAQILGYGKKAGVKTPPTASGPMPRIVVKVVIKTGRKRLRPETTTE